MTTLNDQQRAKLVFVSKKVTNLGDTFTIHGRLGTMEYVGIVPDNPTGDMAASGISRQVRRPGGRRSRWLGDSEGVQVAANTANVAFYPSKGGNAVPGRPIQLINLDATDETTGRNPRGTLSIDGPIGAFYAWLIQNRPPFRCQVIGPSGKPYKGVILPED